MKVGNLKSNAVMNQELVSLVSDSQGSLASKKTHTKIEIEPEHFESRPACYD